MVAPGDVQFTDSLGSQCCCDVKDTVMDRAADCKFRYSRNLSCADELVFSVELSKYTVQS